MSTFTATPTSVHGIDALRLDGDGVSVTVTTAMGPRILALAGPDGRNLLAELPTATIELPGLPVYRMLGGHRLWHTPEVPATTYRPDEGPVIVGELPDGVDLLGADDPIQGVQKRLRVRLLPGGAVSVEHEIRNTASVAITIPFTVATPMRTPVNDPGPTPTAHRATSLALHPASSNVRAIIGRRDSPCAFETRADAVATSLSSS